MSSKLLDVRDLSVGFRQGESATLAVDHVSFSLDQGETLAIVGEFGLGKIGLGAVDPPPPQLSLPPIILRAKSGSAAVIS